MQPVRGLVKCRKPCADHAFLCVFHAVFTALQCNSGSILYQPPGN
jgi:hypothetical protein